MKGLTVYVHPCQDSHMTTHTALAAGTIVRNRKNGKEYRISSSQTWEDAKGNVRIHGFVIKDGNVTGYHSNLLLSDIEPVE